jgi:hypothetical protein
MARLRALLSLLMLTSGAMLAGLAISGYFEAWPPSGLPTQQGQAALAITTPAPAPKAQIVAPQSRQRFVAPESEKRTPTPASTSAKPRAASKATPVSGSPAANTAAVKPRPPAKDRPEAKPSRPQQAAATWPWSMFSN